jgi:SAM-dependent methyltransferase
MPKAPSTTAAYPPALYAAVHRGNAGDVDYYRCVCAGAQSVLELGCGVGRIAHAVAADGCEVVGIERDRGLLDLAPAGPASLLRGDMRAFQLDRRFDRIIAPYNGMYCLLDEDDLLACLGCVREHLAPEGLFVFDGYAADAFHAEGAESAPGWDALEPVAAAEVDGVAWEVLEQSWWDPRTQRIDARYVHVASGGQTVEATISQRYLLSHQVGGLLEHVGLRLMALQGGFDQAAFEPDQSELLIAVATDQA